MKTLKFSILALALLLPVLAAAQLATESKKVKEITYVIDFGTTPWRGETQASMTEVVYIPLGFPMVTTAGVPEGFDNTYPLFFAGDTLQFCVSVKNEGGRSYGDLKVELFHEYLALNIDGAQGAPLGTANRQAWNVNGLKPGQVKTFCGNFFLPANVVSPSLAQTHIRISRGTLADVEPGAVLVNDFMGQIWSFLKP